MSPQPSAKSITFLSRAAPYGTARAWHCLDIALAAAVFDRKVNYIFMADGVYQLLPDQKGEDAGTKTLSKALTALDVYGIKDIYVCQASLSHRHLSPKDLIIPATPVDPPAMQSLLSESHCVFNL